MQVGRQRNLEISKLLGDPWLLQLGRSEGKVLLMAAPVKGHSIGKQGVFAAISRTGLRPGRSHLSHFSFPSLSSPSSLWYPGSGS